MKKLMHIYTNFAIGLKFATVLILVLAFMVQLPPYSSDVIEISDTKDHNPCCEFPCLNMGICINYANNSYSCDCTGTGHYGLNCHIPHWTEAIKKAFKPEPEKLHNILTGSTWLFSVINSVPFLHRRIIKYVYMTRGSIIDSPSRFESDHSYITLDAYFNESFYARTLPPVPLECPTPMGVKGPKTLLAPKELFQRVFLRRDFKADPFRSNLLFQYYAQHFTHQFLRTNTSTDGRLTVGSGGVDVSNIYGSTESHRQGLRSKIDGKLKTMLVNDEQFPPMLKDVRGVPDEYPPHLQIPEESKFALGNPFFSLLPGLLMYSTIWLREHNRVCDILKAEHPHWDDERLYQTTRLVILGEVIKITIEDYVQHLSQYKLKLIFDPELLQGTDYQFDNRIRAEFAQMYHWHSMVPNGILINETFYTTKEMMFTNKAIFKHGFENFVETLARSRAGALTARNHPAVTEGIFVKTIMNSRSMRFAGFNEYRKRFGMQPYQTFQELTGETELSKELENIYEHVDAVEFYVGLLAESPAPSVTPVTMVNSGGPWSIKGLLSNPICSPRWWKPSTFGGKVGFDIIKTASLKNLFCRNLKGSCDHIKFTVSD